MKKSNKLLLGGFLTGVLLLVAIHITLYAKYKNGNYTRYTDAEDVAGLPIQSFPNILFVSVQNVPHASVKFGNVASVRASENAFVKYTRNGDTLLITGGPDNTFSDVDRRVLLNVPDNAALSLLNSTLYFQAVSDSESHSPTIFLNKSILFFEGPGKIRFNTLKLTASNKSDILFRGPTNVNQLEAKLNDSYMEYRDGSINQVKITADKQSRLSFPSEIMSKASIQLTPNQ